MNIFGHSKDVRERLREGLPNILEFVTENEIIAYEVSKEDVWGRYKERFVFRKDNVKVELTVEVDGRKAADGKT